MFRCVTKLTPVSSPAVSWPVCTLLTIAWPLPVGKDLSLPTKDGTWAKLCDQATDTFDRVIEIAMSKIGLPSVVGSIFGGAVKAGLFGKYPSLTDLDRGDLKFNTDFRSVYGTVLDKWLKAPSQTVLGRKFPAIGLV